jgi:hypothetical protein
MCLYLLCGAADDQLQKTTSEGRRPRRDAERKTVITNDIQLLRTQQIEDDGYSSISPRHAKSSIDFSSVSQQPSQPVTTFTSKLPVNYNRRSCVHIYIYMCCSTLYIYSLKSLLKRKLKRNHQQQRRLQQQQQQHYQQKKMKKV